MVLGGRVVVTWVVLILSRDIVYTNAQQRDTDPESPFQLRDIQLPRGFSIQSYTNGRLPNARSLALSTSTEIDETILYVSTRTSGEVYAVVDDNNDGVAEHVYVVLRNMRSPNGIAWRDGSLYVATVDNVLRYDDVDQLALEGRRLINPLLIQEGFPMTQDHFWRYIGFGPDGKLYIAVGIRCNRCVSRSHGDIVDGTIMRMNTDGSEFEVFVEGIRNSVGFDWHPFTEELFFTDNGADGMGNNFPDDVLQIGLEGDDFRFPHCHIRGLGNPYDRQVGRYEVVPDRRYGQRCEPRNRKSPVQALGPHVAALGMRFYVGDMFPRRYKNSIFIAEHGSWDRDRKIGYRVVNVKLGDDNRTAVDHEIFATGWEREQETFGRPVDILELPDGSLLVSDSFANDTYRITYNPDHDRDPSRKTNRRR